MAKKRKGLPRRIYEAVEPCTAAQHNLVEVILDLVESKDWDGALSVAEAAAAHETALLGQSVGFRSVAGLLIHEHFDRQEAEEDDEDLDDDDDD